MWICEAQDDPKNIFGRSFPERVSARLKQIESRRHEIIKELETLPVMSDVDALGTHGFHSNFTTESEVNWCEIRWKSPQTINSIAMIPTRITTQSGGRSNYGFPSRLRIEATRAGESRPFVLAEVPDTQLALREGEPLFIPVETQEITSLRVVPLDLPTLPGKDVCFFSLAELMVYHGTDNIAREGMLKANYSIEREAGWGLQYLTDAQSPLGPPELPQPGECLGWHADSGKADTATWARIDLGQSLVLDSVRLVAARGDAPIKGAGFGFPVRFRIEVADDLSETAWQRVWGNGETNFPNPGYNPATFRFPPVSARYVRLTITQRDQPDLQTNARVLISEMEVLQNGVNVALGKPVSSPDKRQRVDHDSTRFWSIAGLTDGYSSTGRLIHERDWAASLAHRFELRRENRLLGIERLRLLEYWRNFSLALSFSVLSAALLAMAFWLFRSRQLNRRAVIALRSRISSDLHDEVGSNLATIAMIAELQAGPHDLDDISRLSRETSLALREIMDITLGRERPRKHLPERLRDIASLMLRDHEWAFEGSVSPEFDLEQRKELVFYFKETLHNIIRHADATHVRISLEKSTSHFRLIVEDDGKGVEDCSLDVVGLHTLRQRAERLGGIFEIESEPGKGTCLTLLFPIPPKK